MFSQGINAPDYIQKISATSLGRGALEIIRRIELIPGGLLLSRSRFCFTQQLNFQSKNYIYNLSKNAATYDSMIEVQRNEQPPIIKHYIRFSKFLEGQAPLNDKQEHRNPACPYSSQALREAAIAIIPR